MDRTESAGTGKKKQWMAYALALSLVLHIGAALLVVFATSTGRSTKTPGSIIIQEVALTPAISTAAPAATVPPPSPALPEPEAAGDPEPSPGQQPPLTPDEQNRALMSTPLGLGMTQGYFAGLADGMTLREDIRDYYFEMVGRINEEWWNRSKTLAEPLRQDGVVELTILRDGTIVTIRTLQRTGSREADRLLTESIQNSRLAPLPASYKLDVFAVPLRIKAPSSLFRLSR